MATANTLLGRVANAAAEARVNTLRHQMQFAAARLNGIPEGPGAAVLTEAQRADINGDDEKFCAKPVPNH